MTRDSTTQRSSWIHATDVYATSFAVGKAFEAVSQTRPDISLGEICIGTMEALMKCFIACGAFVVTANDDVPEKDEGQERGDG